MDRWLGVLLASKTAYRLHQRHEWGSQTFRVQDCLTLAQLAPTSPANLATSPILAQLVFTRSTNNAYTHLSHTLHYIPETTSHRHLRARHMRFKKSLTPPTSPTKVESVYFSVSYIFACTDCSVWPDMQLVSFCFVLFFRCVSRSKDVKIYTLNLDHLCIGENDSMLKATVY